MTVYEHIISLSIEEMASFLYEICHSKDLQFLKHLKKNNFDITFIEESKEIQIAKQLQLLQTQIEGDE